MRFARGMIAVAALVTSSMLSAQAPAPASPTDERRLTPEQIEAVLAEAAAKRAAAEKQAPAREFAVDQDAPPPPPQLHGELGISVGTGGYREIFGTGFYPIGENGGAAISLDFVDWGHRRFPDKK